MSKPRPQPTQRLRAPVPVAIPARAQTTPSINNTTTTVHVSFTKKKWDAGPPSLVLGAGGAPAATTPPPEAAPQPNASETMAQIGTVVDQVVQQLAHEAGHEVHHVMRGHQEAVNRERYAAEAQGVMLTSQRQRWDRMRSYGVLLEETPSQVADNPQRPLLLGAGPVGSFSRRVVTVPRPPNVKGYTDAYCYAPS